MTPSQQFHSFGFSARDFYHDLDQNEARRWYYFDKFKMILHHNKVQFTVIWFVKFQVRKCPFLLVFSKAYLGGRGSKNPKNVLTTRTVYEWSPINYSTLLIRNFKLENSKKGYWIQWTLTRSVKVENISEDSLDLIHHLQGKFQLLTEKLTWGNKAKHCWVMSTNLLFSKVCWKCPAMFCLYTSNKISRP